VPGIGAAGNRHSSAGWNPVIVIPAQAGIQARIWSATNPFVAGATAEGAANIVIQT
jgi:hypothetical protein